MRTSMAKVLLLPVEKAHNIANCQQMHSLFSVFCQQLSKCDQGNPDGPQDLFRDLQLPVYFLNNINGSFDIFTPYSLMGIQMSFPEATWPMILPQVESRGRYENPRVFYKPDKIIDLKIV